MTPAQDRKSGSRRPGWRTWAGLTLPPIAWWIHHQAGSDLNFANCRVGDAMLALLIGVAALALSLIGIALSLLSWHSAGASTNTSQEPVGRFLPALGLLLGGLMALTILMQTAAALIVPSCFR